MGGKLRHFAVSILVVIIFPLFPILIECLVSEITILSLTLTGAIYCISVGTSSREFYLLLLAIFISMLFSFLHGFIYQGQILGTDKYYSQHCYIVTIIGIILITLLHIIERYVRHISEGELFYQRFK